MSMSPYHITFTIFWRAPGKYGERENETTIID